MANKWKKETLKLQKNHGWKAKPGYKIFVADRGAVRFDIPESWILEPGKDSFKFHDKQPPDDDCRLEVSVMYLRPDVDWSRFPLDNLLMEALKGDTRGITFPKGVVTAKRPNLELAWVEGAFVDPNEKRDARSRACLARGKSVQRYVVQPFITLDYWLDDAKWATPVWDEVIRSLQLGDYIEDPTKLKLN